ncbi:hypothetical protein SASPL_124638 [Salvia splendens]|uniref:FAD-binding domain-containing protein n=1 Tax=Salvia splendens TaxID=180675 RepID=A0A8X8XDV1_SALSN|nr:hypothetical protein SASPL_124638 [Salvia splendens]
MEDIVIVGAGIAGLATSLGLHRLGVRSVVLESADGLRASGFALGIWANGWRALDAIGLGNILREKHNKISGDDLEYRCVNRGVLLETLENELPRGTIRYSSKVVHIHSEGRVKSLHLSDATVLRTKVLIGCDGVNSVVSKFLGFSKPAYAGRTEVRGFVCFKDGHGFEPKFMQFFGEGVRFGVIPCDGCNVYWFLTFTPSSQEKEMVKDPTKVKQLVLMKFGKASDKIRRMVWGNISKGNVCVLGDALHPMTPEMGQGGCSALEDSVVLARLLAGALRRSDGDNEHRAVSEALENLARERRWRCFDLISSSYIVGFMQESDGVLVQFLRDKFMAGVVLKRACFDCGDLALEV